MLITLMMMLMMNENDDDDDDDDDDAEDIVGKALVGRRDKVVLATKCGLVWHCQKGNHFFDYDGQPVHRYLGKDGIIHEVEQSLKRLKTDYIDHYITHWQDPTTPIA